jgi:hypothetical protein
MGAKELEKAEEQGLMEFFKLTSKINTSNMICFDFDGKIKKYKSPEEIIEDFYPVRLSHYQKRKVCSLTPSGDHSSADLNVSLGLPGTRSHPSVRPLIKSSSLCSPHRAEGADRLEPQEGCDR